MCVFEQSFAESNYGIGAVEILARLRKIPERHVTTKTMRQKLSPHYLVCHAL